MMAGHEHHRRRVCVVTGSRAEFGLLLPVIRAIEAHEKLELLVVAGGSHLVGRSPTIEDVRSACRVDAQVMMQVDGDARTRPQDAVDVGRGVSGFAAAFAELKPDWVVVLGDRIEAFAAGAAASIGGFALAHIHGGDRAEGVADEAMRHAISKLAHLHLAATEQSADRLRRMGEEERRIHVVGSPALDDLSNIEPLTDDEVLQRFNKRDIRCVLLLHPSGFADVEAERSLCQSVVDACAGVFGDAVLALSPNHDAGREVIVQELDSAAARHRWSRADHLPRPVFIGLLKRLAHIGFASSGGRLGVLVGNSSAGLIEASALRVGVVNVGPRQDGRERPVSHALTDVPFEPMFSGKGRAALMSAEIKRAIEQISLRREGVGVKGGGEGHADREFGDGGAGERIASILAGRPPGLGVDPHDPLTRRKRNSY